MHSGALSASQPFLACQLVLGCLPQGALAAITYMPQLVLHAGIFGMQGVHPTGQETGPGACDWVLVCGAAG